MNYEQLLIKLCEEDERIIIMTAENRAAIRNIPAILKERFIDVGIAEQTLVGMAAGLALRGKKPVIHALSSFLTMRAFEFIRTDIGIANLPVKMIGAFPGVLSEANGPTHQAIEDISIMRGIPSVNVFSPADEDDMLKCLPKIIADKSPWYIRYNNMKSEVTHSEEFIPGQAEVFFEGKDITILTHGALFATALKTRSRLEEMKFSTGLVNMRTVKPLDGLLIKHLVSSTGLLVTIEDHFQTGGLFSALSEYMILNHLSLPVLPIAFNNWFKPALLKDIMVYEKLTPNSLAEKIKDNFQTKADYSAQYYF
jgi:transketolase